MKRTEAEALMSYTKNITIGLRRVVNMIADPLETNTPERYEACVRYIVLIQRQISAVVWLGGNVRRKKPGPNSKYGVKLSGFLVDCITALAHKHFPDAKEAEAEIWRIVCMR